jgi:acetyl esterase/lipase
MTIAVVRRIIGADGEFVRPIGEETNMSTSILELPRVIARTNRRARRLARAAAIVGGILSFSALALGSAQFYRVSAATLGPGAFLLTIPKQLGGALAPFLAVAGAAGAACGLAALWLGRDRGAQTAKRPGLGASLVVVAGLAAAAMSAIYTQQILAARGDFAAAFGAGWQERIPAQLRGGLLPQRWSWRLPAAPEVQIERDVTFATVPGTERKLLADLYSPPAGVAPTGLGFIYLHGGGYSAFDKGGPTEPWFRHLAAQGHVVMDVAYRLIPETTVPEMQGDVKRAIAWLKRNANGYGVDPDHIVLGGGSAGSHLALLAAYAPYHPLFIPEDVRGANLAVRGVIGYYNAGDYRQESRPIVKRTALEQAVVGPLTSFFGMMAGSEIAVDDTGDWDPNLFFGGPPDAWPELYRQVSPIVHVGPEVPPTLQIVGEHDVYGGSRSVAALHARLLTAGVPAVQLRLPRTDHAFDLFLPEISPTAQTAMYDVDRFLALMAAPVDWNNASRTN